MVVGQVTAATFDSIIIIVVLNIMTKGSHFISALKRRISLEKVVPPLIYYHFKIKYVAQFSAVVDDDGT
jgi:hypothetical protein